MAQGSKFVLALGLAAAALLGASQGIAQSAEDPAIAGARASGAVGEQADGYLGFAKTPSAALRAAVDAVNIKRRAVYTDLAAKRGVRIQDVAAARGCDQLRDRVQTGEAYLLPDGTWRTKSGPITLPSYCN